MCNREWTLYFPIVFYYKLFTTDSVLDLSESVQSLIVVYFPVQCQKPYANGRRDGNKKKERENGRGR